MEATSTATTIPSTSFAPPAHPRRNHGRQNRSRNNDDARTSSSGNVDATERPANQNRNRTGNGKAPSQAETRPGNGEDSGSGRMHASGSASRPYRPRGKPGEKRPSKPSNTVANAESQPHQPTHSNRRRANFNPSLTTESPAASSSSDSRPHSRRRPKPQPKEPVADDLTSTLTHALSTPPYPDCPICFSSIHPAQPIWSCSPSIGESSSTCCYTPFHLKCIRSWASKSVKDIEDAYAARGEIGKKGEWRCPGCQKRRETVPTGYSCFCGSTAAPTLTRLATPHSCGNPCSRPRSTTNNLSDDDNPPCNHPCPLPCHPGPCPPCQVTVRMHCHCGKDELAFKCRQLAVVTDTEDVRSCGQKCAKLLNCEKHECQRTCHAGPCEPCELKVTKNCWCGKQEKEEICGENRNDRYSCGGICAKSYRCGIHSCEQKCHPEHLDITEEETCPLDPSVFTHCPCGKVELVPSSIVSLSARSRSSLPRSSCTDPIPTCTSQCGKILPSCSHPCQALCHLGDCPPCTEIVQRYCRCGASRKSIQCSNLYDSTTGVELEVLCEKPCGALRACGRHQCNRICCPLAGFATGPTSGKGKGRRRGVNTQGDVELDLASVGGLHECDLVCGKMLSCGKHRCEARDHKGSCPPCLRSSFEEIVCHCGRTVLDPPIPCGTVLRCPFPCMRPPPPCGHPKVPHACHGRVEDRDIDVAEELGEDGEVRRGGENGGCPPCPHLVSKICACGKKEVPNVRCSTAREKVRCGGVCGKLMNCGFHHCERLCHSGECGGCTATCGKARRLCLPLNHPCTLPCHAPSVCSEAEPCHAIITVSCPCGRIQQAVHCGRSTSNPHPDADGSSRSNAPKCNNECAIAKRNARLADALGINPQTKEKSVTATYSDELVAFAKSDMKFLALVEKTFADFIQGEKRTQVLPHMPIERRKFVHDLATVYRIGTQMVDQEPHRSVQLLRRIDTRIPTPTLSSHISSMKPTGPNFGKLADLSLRSGSPSWRSSTSGTSSVAMPVASRSAATTNALASGSTGTGRAWGTVPVRSNNASPSKGLGSATAAISRGASPLPGARAVPQVVEQKARINDTVEPSTPVPADWEDDPDV